MIKKISLTNLIVLGFISLLGLWHLLAKFGVPTYGSFSSWFILLLGVYLFANNYESKKFVAPTIVTLIGIHNLCKDLGIKYFARDTLFYFLMFLLPALILVSQFFGRKKQVSDNFSGPDQNRY
jgi:hypothetical protein